MIITMSFGVKEVFKDQERGWYDDIKKSEKPKLGMSPWYIPAYLKNTQASKLGMPKASPSSSTKYQVISSETIF